MNNGITIPLPIFERLHDVVERLVAKIDPKDKEAQKARRDAVAVLQEVANIADDEVVRDVNDVVYATRAEKNGAQILLALAEKAEREGWSGPADLSTNHNSYFVQTWNEQEATKHPKI